jgi:uncharacterized protein YcbK (DUF882 family)
MKKISSPPSLDVSSRRGFLLGVSAAGLALALPQSGVLQAATPIVPDSLTGSALSSAAPRWLELFNTHTSESLHVAYRSAVGLVAPAIAKLQWLLRDHRAGESAPIDADIFDQLAMLAEKAGVEPRYEVISGYRAPRTNAALQAAGRGVATRSLHTQGRAIDVRLRGVSCATLRDLAIAAARGGVGYYRRSEFVHLDTGRVRAWAG